MHYLCTLKRIVSLHIKNYIKHIKNQTNNNKHESKDFTME